VSVNTPPGVVNDNRGVSTAGPAFAGSGAGPASTLNVGAYGARGDGIADDTSAIQAAINAGGASYAATGAPSVITGAPGALYRLSFTGPTAAFQYMGNVTAALQIRSGVFLYGMSFSVPDYPGFNVAAVIDDGIGYPYWGVDRCRFNGHAARGLNTEYNHQAILFAAASDVWITRNTFTLFRQSAIQSISPSNTNLCHHVWVEDNDITLCQGGAIKFNGGATDLWILNNRCANNTGIVDGTYAGAEQIYIGDDTGLNARIVIAGNQLTNWGSCIVFGCGAYCHIYGNYMAPPPGGACWSVERYAGAGVVSSTNIHDNQILGSTDTPAIQPYTSDHLHVHNNLYTGRQSASTSTFINEVGVGTANLYTDNLLGIAAPGSGRVRLAVINAASTSKVKGNRGDYAGGGFADMSIIVGADPEIGLPGHPAPTTAPSMSPRPPPPSP
jgi:hypothetical protein